MADVRSFGRKPMSPEKMLAIVDELRESIVDGKLVAFAAVGLDAGDTVYGYIGALPGVTRLRVQGAIADLQHTYLCGALDDE
jgi:hypothetical protein